MVDDFKVFQITAEVRLMMGFITIAFVVKSKKGYSLTTTVISVSQV